MTPEDKLEKVEELLAARDEITQELLELMGAPVDDEEEQEDEPATPAKKERKCSVCSKPGHTAKRCAKNRPETFGFTSKDQPVKRASRKPCDECGSAGTRHFKSCSKATPIAASSRGEALPSKGRTILDAPLRLTEDEYKAAKEALGDGLSPYEVGFSYPHVEKLEFAKVSDSDSYADYLSR